MLRDNFLNKHRFLQVTESITIVSLFNTLKYFPSKSSLFEDKLLKYSNTLPNVKNKIIKYEYVKILKQKNGFIYKPSAYYLVDLKINKIEEIIIDEKYHPSNKAFNSPVRESLDFGSYEKKRS